MKFNIKSLLRDKNVLRIVAVISVLNLMGYLMLGNLDAVAFFVIVGFLSTYFSKNMIVVLLISMIATNFLTATKVTTKGFTEGMKGNRKTTKKVKDDAVKADDEADEDIEASGKAGKLDNAATIEAAHNNIEQMIGSGGISQMSKDTKKLMKQQQQLNESLTNIMPAVEESMKTLEKFGGMEKISDMVGKLSGVFGKK